MLEQIKSVKDLQKLDVKQLPQLCAEIRQKLVDEVLISGGHLASNLGVVELTVALHYVFGEDDKIVWDVGHQSYVHKILTGRGENFSSLRSQGGLSGFPDSEESASDAFTTGHAGTAISVALGLAKSRDNLGQNHKVIAVVGDGSMTCGLTYEALNNVKDTNVIIVLNDNNMSIGDSVGSATKNMSKLRVGKYDENKEKLKKFLLKLPLIGKPLYRFLRWCKRKLKLKYVRNSYFDIFDLKYIGIIDGNEIKDLVYYLTKIRDNVHKPTVLHIVTKKGKGYAPAEVDAESYHAVPRNNHQIDFDSSCVVGKVVCDLANSGSNIACISAAMTKAVGFAEFAKNFPEKYFDVGIAEEHAVSFAGGLAKGGSHPIVAIYSTFMQRAFDQILHDVALQNLGATFLLDRAGFVGDDGKTHQGLFDLSYLSQIPNLQVWTPSSYSQLEQMIVKSVRCNSPTAIRYSRTLSSDNLTFDGSWQYVHKSSKAKVVILAVGSRCLQIAKQCASESVDVVCVTSIKPLDVNLLNNLSDDIAVITMEENVCIGGFGQQVVFALNQLDKRCKVHCLSVDDTFVSHADVAAQMSQNGIDLKNLQNIIAKYV